MAGAQRLRTTDVVLLATVVLQASIVTASRYLVGHGLAPSVYIALRFAVAAPLLAVVAIRVDGGLAVSGRRMRLFALLAIGLGFSSQTAFAHAIHLSSAATVGVITGSVPILTMLIAAAVRVESLSPRIVVAASVSLVGVALVTLGPGSAVTGGAVGSGLALLAAACWAGHSVAVVRLASQYSALRTSALVTVGIAVLLLASAAAPLNSQHYALGWAVWAVLVGVGLATAAVNLLWFHALRQVGASRASLYSNLQPFFVVVLSVVLLGEVVTGWTFAGGAVITAGLVAARRWGVSRRQPGARLTAAAVD